MVVRLAGADRAIPRIRTNSIPDSGTVEFRSHYWDDRESREAFKRFLVSIHGLDLTRWEEHGYWDDSYIPFSFFLEGDVVASVCLYLIDCHFRGKRCKVAQISAVGTRERLRKRGLNRELTRRALDWAGDRCEGLFLFADEQARGFYDRLGFEPRQDYHWISVPDEAPPPRDGKRLDTSSRSDLEWIFDLAEGRVPVSREFSSYQTRLLMFHLLYDPSCRVTRIPDRELALVSRDTEDGVQVLDILGKEVPAFSDWYPYVVRPGKTRLELRLPIDLIQPPAPTREPLDSGAFVKPGFPIEKPVFPATIVA